MHVFSLTLSCHLVVIKCTAYDSIYLTAQNTANEQLAGSAGLYHKYDSIVYNTNNMFPPVYDDVETNDVTSGNADSHDDYLVPIQLNVDIETEPNNRLCQTVL